MLNFSNNVSKGDLLGALARLDNNVCICRITAGSDGKLIVEGKQGNRGVVYVYKDQSWIGV